MTLDERTLSIADYLAHPGGDDLLVDLRSPETFAMGTIPGAVNIPDEEEDALLALPHDRRIVLFCHKGETSEDVLPLLLEEGYDAVHLAGGYRAYHRHMLISGYRSAAGGTDHG